MPAHRCSIRIAALLAALLAARTFPAGAEERLVLPGLASTAGAAGTRFVSTVWLMNPNDVEVTADLGLVTPAGPAPAAARVTIEPRATLRLDDPVAALFGAAPGAGTLTVRAASPVLVRGVTANVADPRGTFGLALTASRAGDALRAGETGVGAWLAHTAAAGTLSRTNVAVTLLEAGSETLVTLVDDSGLVRGEERVAGDAPLFWQRSVSEIAADPEIPLGRVEVTVLRGSAVAYAAVVDNVTGDGILAPVRRTENPPGPPFALLADGVARTPGANGTLWRTALRLVNPGLVPVEATLESAGIGAVARATRVVPPRGILEVDDVLGALGLSEGSAGAVRVTSGARLAALASTRSVDPAGRAGTFAAAQEPVPAGALAGPGTRLVFAGLAHATGSAGFRTNLAILSGEGGAHAALRLRSAAGVNLAEGTADVAPGAWVQRALPEWFSGASVPPDASVEMTVVSGSLDAYASVIDNGTGDPVLLRPWAAPASGCAAAPVLTSSAARVDAGGAVTLRLEASPGGGGRIVPGDLALAAGGSLPVTPAVTTTYRWLPEGACTEAPSAAATVEVAAPGGTLLTEPGALRGVVGMNAVSYRGIPFAAPPTGDLRWRPPAPAAPWTGVRNATTFGPICPQLDDGGAATGAENCLSLNVWAPAAPPASPLPVLFFIHGGGNAQGASSLDYYDGSVFAGKGRAVVVTTNYRLSSFGWLAQPYLSLENRRGGSGNYGLFDVLAALRWVKRNAAAFGGDASRVTIFGESAGAVNTCSLVASPLAKGLFSGALMESGGCNQRPVSEFVTFGSKLTTNAGCAAAADPAACMRGKSSDAILAALPPDVSVVSSTGQLWGPAVDGFTLKESPEAALLHGTHNKVPFAVGANADETGASAPFISSEAEYRALVTSQAGILAPLVLAQYPASAYATPRKAYVALTTDSRFVCPSRRIARAALAGGSPAVYRYFFSYPANRLYGAIHGVELPFVFSSASSVPGYTPTPSELALSEAMNAAWGRLAAAGDPNGAGVPAWQRYDAARDSTLVWDIPSAARDGIRTAACDFWDALTPAP
jgi:para-nitrobenzyl esterase